MLYIFFQLVAFVREHMWHKALLMGYLMRLELTLVSSLNDLCLVKLVYKRVILPLECVYFGLLYPSSIFDVYSCVCVCVCFANSFFFVCVGVYLGEFCGFKFTGSSFSFFFLYMYTVVLQVHPCVISFRIFFFFFFAGGDFIYSYFSVTAFKYNIKLLTLIFPNSFQIFLSLFFVCLFFFGGEAFLFAES